MVSNQYLATGAGVLHHQRHIFTEPYSKWASSCFNSAFTSYSSVQYDNGWTKLVSSAGNQCFCSCGWQPCKHSVTSGYYFDCSLMVHTYVNWRTPHERGCSNGRFSRSTSACRTGTAES